ncbi:hypothetical protein yfred0001_70 [Yersinia frederiksenii ATCC 33641]|nr:hypothetical protein yfred0001_70 [Yersinia frederiksenii ATCC 33641]
MTINPHYLPPACIASLPTHIICQRRMVTIKGVSLLPASGFSGLLSDLLPGGLLQKMELS